MRTPAINKAKEIERRAIAHLGFLLTDGSYTVRSVGMTANKSHLELNDLHEPSLSPIEVIVFIEVVALTYPRENSPRRFIALVRKYQKDREQEAITYLR